MTSGTFDKTMESLGSLFSPLGTEFGLKNMLEQCVCSRTKKEEEWLIRSGLNLVQAKLNEPSVKASIITKCLAFVIFAENCGYKAEFAYIHAINLAQHGSLREKKIGYLACMFLLDQKHSLSVLLVNTILRDLISNNIVIVGMALSACCHFIPVEQAPTLLSLLNEKLTHSSEYIRGKSLIVLHNFLRLYPEVCQWYVGCVKRMLGDKNPEVVALALQCLVDISKSESDIVEVVPALLEIQQQILEEKLPVDFVYRGMVAPWMQLTIIRLLALTCKPAASVVLIIKQTLNLAKNGVETAIKVAIVCECVTTLMKLEQDEKLLDVAMAYVSSLLSHKSSNLRYCGLSLLEKIVRAYKIPLSPTQQEMVVSNLKHPDQSVKRQTLSLLCSVADAKSAEMVCSHVADFLQESGNEVSNSDLVDKALNLTDRYADNQSLWHMAVLIRLLSLIEQTQVRAVQRRIQLRLMSENEDSHTLRAKTMLIQILQKYSELKTVSTSVLEVYVWILSYSCESSAEKVEDGMEVLEKLVTLGRKVLRNQEHVSEGVTKLLVSIVQSAGIICEKYRTTAPFLIEFLRETTKSVLGSAYVRDVCKEVYHLLPYVNEVNEILHQTKEGEETLDFSLSFLDEYVCESLESGRQPYQSKVFSVIQYSIPDIPAVSEHITSSPSLSVMSNDSSALDLPRSCFSLEESKSWSLVSPQREKQPQKIVWSKTGRMKESDICEQEEEHVSQHLGVLLSQGETSCDPLEELLTKNFSKLALKKDEILEETDKR